MENREVPILHKDLTLNRAEIFFPEGRESFYPTGISRSDKK
jgi:hypothetical protein